MFHILNLYMWNNIDTKRTLIKKNFYSLWHRHLDTSRKRESKNLYLVELRSFRLPQVPNLGVCTDCIKEKQTNIIKFGAKRSSGVLNLVCTDICEIFPTALWNNHRYFITFKDDYSRYKYLCLIHEKSQSLDMFKIYKVEVENQQNREIKAARSDHGGEFMTYTTDQIEI